MRIYTGTGDDGKTSLYGGKRVLKSDLRMEAYGTIDELNSAIGVVITIGDQRQKTKDKRQDKRKKITVKINRWLKEIQKDLLLIGSLLAGYDNNQQLTINSQQLEKWIYELERKLPSLRNFILPDGTKTASFLHFARSICRRAERRVVELWQKEKPGVSRELHPRGGIRFTPQDKSIKEITIYLNRLSDLLFEMARSVNFKEGIQEITWQL